MKIFLTKSDQNCNFFSCWKGSHWPPKCTNKQRSLDLVIKISDPRISRIAKIFVQNRPKFLDLYASIYGNKRCNFILTRFFITAHNACCQPAAVTFRYLSCCATTFIETLLLRIVVQVLKIDYMCGRFKLKINLRNVKLLWHVKILSRLKNKYFLKLSFNSRKFCILSYEMPRVWSYNKLSTSRDT